MNTKTKKVKGPTKKELMAEKIRPLSADYTPKEIAKMLGIPYNMVTIVQSDPKYNIQNAKRERNIKFLKDRTAPAEGCFDYNDKSQYL